MDKGSCWLALRPGAASACGRAGWLRLREKRLTSSNTGKEMRSQLAEIACNCLQSGPAALEGAALALAEGVRLVNAVDQT
ncbi:MAG: hypothetical protein J5600_02985, partial [Desulfovibrio sp.]|nr:hypothetical protein [Desulfovibrio sp.]